MLVDDITYTNLIYQFLKKRWPICVPITPVWAKFLPKTIILKKWMSFYHQILNFEPLWFKFFENFETIHSHSKFSPWEGAMIYHKLILLPMSETHPQTGFHIKYPFPQRQNYWDNFIIIFKCIPCKLLHILFCSCCCCFFFFPRSGIKTNEYSISWALKGKSLACREQHINHVSWSHSISIPNEYWQDEGKFDRTVETLCQVKHSNPRHHSQTQ